MVTNLLQKEEVNVANGEVSHVLGKRHLCPVTASGSARISPGSWGKAETNGMGQQEKAFLVEGTAWAKTRRHESEVCRGYWPAIVLPACDQQGVMREGRTGAVACPLLANKKPVLVS